MRHALVRCQGWLRLWHTATTTTIAGAAAQHIGAGTARRLSAPGLWWRCVGVRNRSDAGGVRTLRRLKLPGTWWRCVGVRDCALPSSRVAVRGVILFAGDASSGTDGGILHRLRFLDPCQGYRGAARLRELRLRGARLGARGDSLLPRGGAGDHCTILAGENDRELFEGALLKNRGILSDFNPPYFHLPPAVSTLDSF